MLDPKLTCPTPVCTARLSTVDNTELRRNHLGAEATLIAPALWLCRAAWSRNWWLPQNHLGQSLWLSRSVSPPAAWHVVADSAFPLACTAIEGFVLVMLQMHAACGSVDAINAYAQVCLRLQSIPAHKETSVCNHLGGESFR